MTDVFPLTKKMVSIHSEHPEEGNYEMVGFLTDYLHDIGLKPEKQQVGPKTFNVICPGKGNVLVVGHTDTVEIGDPKKWRHNPFGEIGKKRIYGRGTSDTKGNIACFLSALAEKPTDKISLGFTAIEESGFNGIEKLMEVRETKLRKVKYGIVLEPTDGKIVSACKGVIVFDVIARGRAAHGSVPHKGENAIKKLYATICNLRYYENSLKRIKYKTLGSPTINIGLIEGGNAANIVPDFAKMTVDRRVVPGENPELIIKKLKKVCAPLKVEIKRSIDAAEADPDSKIIKMMEGILRSEGLNHTLHVKQGTTELTSLLKNNIEGFVYGPGQPWEAHRTNEYIETEKLKEIKKIFEETIRKIEISPEF